MNNLKPDVVQALRDNTALMDLLGGERIYQLVAPRADEFPRITFFELDNVDSDFADDVPIAAEVLMQVDVWSKGSTTELAQQVDVTLKSIGFSRVGSGDLYESDTKVYHKAMRYRAKTGG